MVRSNAVQWPLYLHDLNPEITASLAQCLPKKL